MAIDIEKFKDIKPGYSFNTNHCNRCKKYFIIGEIIYRIVKQDYVSGKNTNAKKQTNKAKLCEECFKKLFVLEVQDETN